MGEAKHKEAKEAERSSNNKDTLKQNAKLLDIYEQLRQWEAQERRTNAIFAWAAGAGRADVVTFLVGKGRYEVVFDESPIGTG